MCKAKNKLVNRTTRRGKPKVANYKKRHGVRWREEYNLALLGGHSPEKPGRAK